MVDLSGVLEKTGNKFKVIGEYLDLLLLEDNSDIVIFVDEKLSTHYWSFPYGEGTGVSEEEAYRNAVELAKKVELGRAGINSKKAFLDAAQFKSLVFGSFYDKMPSDKRKFLKFIVRNDVRGDSPNTILSVVFVAKWYDSKNRRFTYRVFRWDGEFVTTALVLSKRDGKIFSNMMGISGVYKGFSLVSSNPQYTERLHLELEKYNFEVSKLFEENGKPLKKIEFADRIIHRIFYVHTPKGSSATMMDGLYGNYFRNKFKEKDGWVYKLTQEPIESDKGVWEHQSELAVNLLKYLKDYSDATHGKGFYTEAIGGLINTIALEKGKFSTILSDPYFLEESLTPPIAITQMLKRGETIKIDPSEVGKSEAWLEARTNPEKFYRYTLGSLEGLEKPVWIPREVLKALNWTNPKKVPKYHVMGSLDRAVFYIHYEYYWDFSAAPVDTWLSNRDELNLVKERWRDMRLWELNLYNRDSLAASKERLFKSLGFERKNVFETNVPILLEALYLKAKLVEDVEVEKLGEDAVSYLEENTKVLGEDKNWSSVVEKHIDMIQPTKERSEKLLETYSRFGKLNESFKNALKMGGDNVKTYIIMFALMNLGYMLYQRTPKEVKDALGSWGAAGYITLTLFGFAFTDLNNFYDAYNNIKGGEKIEGYAEKAEGKMKEGIISMLKFVLGSIMVGFSTAAYVYGRSPASPYNFMTYVGEKIFGREMGWIFGQIVYPIIQFAVGYIASGGAVGYAVNTLSGYITNQAINLIINHL